MAWFLFFKNREILKFKIGDAAYVEDMSLWFLFFAFPGVEKARGRLFNTYYDPAYQALKNQTKIIGVWDNHDFGKDWGIIIKFKMKLLCIFKGDSTFQYKKEMQEVFLDFVEESVDSPRRKQEGIYDYYDIVFGYFPIKFSLIKVIGRRSIRIILLDVRYHKNLDTSDIV